MLTSLLSLFMDGKLDAAYWFCSAVAQSFAALTALAGVFAVYRLELLRQNLRETATAMLENMQRAYERLPKSDRAPAGLVHHPLVWHHVQSQQDIVSLYRKEYEPVLQEHHATTELRELSELLAVNAAWFEDDSDKARNATWWAIATIVFDALVTGAALSLVLLTPCLRNALLASALTLLLAALVGLSLTACVSIMLLCPGGKRRRPESLSEHRPHLDGSGNRVPEFPQRSSGGRT